MRMYDLPDKRGHFGPYGGVFVAETLIHALDELREAYEWSRSDPEFRAEFAYELEHYVGRPARSITPSVGRTHSVGRRSSSSAKISTTPVRTRSTTPSGKRCSRAEWASRA